MSGLMSRMTLQWKNEFSNNSIRIMYSCYSDDADLGVGGTRR